MASTWDVIPQTHRTILFEQFTSERDSTAGNLYDILNLYNDPDMSDEEMYKEIEKRLEIRSFKEFLEKFQPKVFEFVTGTTEGVPIFKYTTDPTEAQRNNGREIKITEHTYYEMLVNMYSQKGDSGVANIEFNDAKLREILTPKRELDALYDTRRQIPMLMEKREAAVKRNENTATVDKKLNKIIKHAHEQIKNPTALMSIGLDDMTRKISAIDEKILQLNAATPEGGEPPKLLSGRGGFDDEGRWILIPAKSSATDSEENSDSPSDPDGDNSKMFAKKLQGYIEKKSPDETQFTKALIVSAYTGRELVDPFEKMDIAALTEQRGKLVEQKKVIENCFKQAKEEFINALSESVQKLLCVKIFFDHATVKGGDAAKLPHVGLIVSNCKADKLVDDKVKKKFESTMQHLGVTVNDKNKLWFAILPHVLDEYDDEDDLDDEDDDIGFGDENGASKKQSVTNGTSFSAAKSILQILDKCKIMTFFNFVPAPKTTFSALNADTVKELQETLEPINLEHAVFALPNFTIMREGVVPFGENEKISVPAIYIDAAYVAAGMIVAAQQPDYWTEHGFKNGETFLSENACVRIDLESDKITPFFLTKFNRERSIAWNVEVVNALTKNHFGFVFDGDSLRDERIGGYINRTYILNARTLQRKNGEYKPIFRVLMKDFVRAWLKTAKLSASQLNSFLNKTVTEWNLQPKKYKRFEPINLLLREGESIVQDGSSLKVDLLGGEDSLDIEIVD